MSSPTRAQALLLRYEELGALYEHGRESERGSESGGAAGTRRELEVASCAPTAVAA
ncbi:hypothetical protein [Streptomyces sp. G-G2]|uniref:hypothetical protein n=1 Tax=Streptomyces sp. G-G2 TaxID=3046201 RepID=UPI0024B87B35|nr:hypothetical protein [Streptomyces sp. G-G2]MDJ0384812.1 hypothetical protein [Streptomyces sp. G-G2]